MAEHPHHPWRPTLKRRLAIVAGAFILWSVAVEARLVYLQIIRHDMLTGEADDQQSDIVKLVPKRGEIVDRDGNPLAYNVDADSAAANPREISNPEHTIEEFCRALGDCDAAERQRYLKRLTSRDKTGTKRPFAQLRRGLQPEQAKRVAALKLDGVYFVPESRRYYPNRELAAHVLGWVGDEGGAAGIESKYDAFVGGQPGKAVRQFDNKGRTFNQLETPPVPGATVVLTVDQYIQHTAERELAAAVKRAGADGGTVIVLDVRTSEILALANYPTFTPNDIRLSSPENRKNRAVQYAYEPGSTLKIVTAVAALEEKVFRTTDLIHTSPGVFRIGSRRIDEAKGHNYGTLSFEDVIVKSSNVGAVKIGLEVGAERMNHFLSLFGFGAKASQDFGGESKGIMAATSAVNTQVLASLSMGYNIGVTPLQMAAAANAVANGGELIQPRVVKATLRNGVYTPEPRMAPRRVMSAGTAAILTSIMEGVVERGTAKTAQVEGYTIAGKTGTAAKAIPGGYSKTDYNVSFVGFAPSRNPQFTILVVIDTPRKLSAYGGTVAAPVFQNVAQAALIHRGVPPSLNPPAPLLIARRDPNQPQPVSGPAEPPVVTVAGGASDSAAVFPDLVGMSARDAIRMMARLGLRTEVRGSGYVVNQRPAAGSVLNASQAGMLWLERRPPVAADDHASSSDAERVARGRP